MTFASKLLISAALVAALPFAASADGEKGTWDKDAVNQRYEQKGSETSERILSEEQVRDIVKRSGKDGPADVRYLGGPEKAVDTELCCETVEEQLTEKPEIQETTKYIDAVTERNITQPVERTFVQPVERRIVNERTEEITEKTRYEEERLPVRYEEDAVPAVRETVTEDVTVEQVEEATETYYDVITKREVIQPIERTTVVPVKRRIMRPVTETITNKTRYETRHAPLVIEADEIPNVRETVTEDVKVLYRDEVNETVVDVVSERNIHQPVVRTQVQPVERRILRPQSETVTRDKRYEEQRLEKRGETERAPVVQETIIPKVTERTVLEVHDEYVDQINRTIIQPRVVTTIQPVERRVLRAQTENIVAPTRYEEERLGVRYEKQVIPETRTNYIEHVTEEYREEVNESYFDAVTERHVIQPVTRRLIQPVEYRRPNPVTETVTAPTRYETRRASVVVLQVGESCECR